MSSSSKTRRTHALSDPDAEREVLGACVCSPELIPTLGLEAGDFAISRHGLIWAAMVSIAERGMEPEAAAIRDAMVEQGTWERLGGGVPVLIEAISGRLGAYSWNAAFCARKIQRMAVLRAMEREQGAMAVAIAEGDQDGLGAILARLSELRDRALELERTKARPWVDAVLEVVEQATNPQPLDTLPLGLQCLDEHTGGLEPGWLVVVLGPPKAGKTALALGNIARAALLQRRRVLVCSLEMSEPEVIRRWLAGESGVPVRAMKRGDLTGMQHGQLVHASDVVASWQVEVVTGLRTVDEIGAAARRYASDGGLDELVVDYIQLVDNGHDNRVEDVAKTTRGLKLLAQELKCVVVALSQPNNADAKSGEVGLFSGKSSGSIAADCDLMLVPLRDADDPTRAGIKIAGFRHGEARTWELGKMRFDGGRMQFREVP